ncbi:MAG: hypothetical protein CMK06_09850 [Ponticaulis sp.]|nr:hypothetical protein [Ponticaulis sp.]MAT35423.1 hypothetical protein [Ponticaulis sp.]
MANPLWTRFLIAGFALGVPLSPAAMAAPGLDVGQAALCSAAMKIKRDELPPGVRDALIFSKAADYFTRVGSDVGASIFREAETDHREALLDAQANGNPKFTKAVDGCRTYYETSSGE